MQIDFFSTNKKNKKTSIIYKKSELHERMRLCQQLEDSPSPGNALAIRAMVDKAESSLLTLPDPAKPGYFSTKASVTSAHRKI